MNIKIFKTTIKTTSPYDAKMIIALPHLEGYKKWGQNRSFTFENTQHNLRIWKKTFPNAIVEQEEVTERLGNALESVLPTNNPRPAFEYNTLPRKHQQRALDKINSKTDLPHCFGLIMDIGTGKSWTGIAVMAQQWCAGKIDGVLLVAKNGVHSQWVKEQIPRHMSPVVKWKAWVWGKKKKDEKQYEELLQFDGLKIFSINIDSIITKTAEDKIQNFINSCRNRVMMIVDESQDIKNISSLRTQAAIKMGLMCNYRMIMSGTPIAKNLFDAFSQFRFLDKEIFGHKYMTTFKSKFCLLRHNGFGLEIVGHKNVEEFYKIIDPHIFRITTDEALDLPPKVYIEYPFTMTSEQKRMIKELKNEFSTLSLDKSKTTVAHFLPLFTKIQQISCGFFVNENNTITKIENPRLEALKNVLEQRPGKAIIWCRFKQDVLNVLEALGKRAVDYYGNTTTDDRQKNIKAFLDPDSSIEFLVATAKAAGTGLNLQGICKTNIYYSNSSDALDRWQSEGRTWRDGTTETVTYIDLIAVGGRDSKILANLKDKKDISDLALDVFRTLILEDDDY